MFDVVKNMMLNIPGGSNIPPAQSIVSSQLVGKKVNNGATSDNVAVMKQGEAGRQVTEEMLEELVAMHNVKIKFSRHDETGRTMIKVMDRENDQVIREIPAEDALDLAAKIDEMIGVLFDEEV